MDPSSTLLYNITNINSLYFSYFNVIQFNSDSSLPDVYYTSPITNDTIYYPKSGSNAITLSYILGEVGLNYTYIQNESITIEVNFNYDCVASKPNCNPTGTFYLLSDPEQAPFYVYDSYTYPIGSTLYRDSIQL